MCSENKYSIVDLENIEKLRLERETNVFEKCDLLVVDTTEFLNPYIRVTQTEDEKKQIMFYFESKLYLENINEKNNIKIEQAIDEYLEDLSDKEKIFLTLYPDDLYQPKINIPKKTRSRHFLFRTKSPASLDKILKTPLVERIFWVVEKEPFTNEIIINGFFSRVNCTIATSQIKKFDCFVMPAIMTPITAISLVTRQNFAVFGPFQVLRENNNYVAEKEEKIKTENIKDDLQISSDASSSNLELTQDTKENIKNKSSSKNDEKHINEIRKIIETVLQLIEHGKIEESKGILQDILEYLSLVD